MIDSGTKLCGFPIHVCEHGESVGGDKKLPIVKGALAFKITGVQMLPPVKFKTTAMMLAEGEDEGRRLLKNKSLRRLEARWIRKHRPPTSTKKYRTTKCRECG